MRGRYNYKFTKLAMEDIDQALSYIANVLVNPIAARKLYTQIECAIHYICSFPYASPDCSCYLIGEEQIRHIKVGNYILIYEIKVEIHTIYILRFCYAKMDFIHLRIDH
ncbi:MAG: type II toxin-antitoxin system RelE/ParE family toxin [Clostridia bacterium]|nr:type II toxin-antitoxin system RelE/ParE family toxin [Clostridia bacterium]